MASIKIVLRKKKNKDGSTPDLLPLTIRITKDRRTSFIYLGYNLREDQWDAAAQKVKKNHPNATRLNNYIIKKLAEANDASLDLETQKSEVSSKAVKQKIKPTAGTSFFAQAELYLENLKKSGKYNQFTADKPRIKHFREYLGGEDIAFSDITVALLEGFRVYLKSTHVIANSVKGKEQKPKRIGERSIINHLVAVRTVFSQAIKGEVTNRKYYPFGPGKIRIKFPESEKMGLNADEVKQLEVLELPIDSPENHARNLWLFSFYLAGMRVSDVLRLKWSDIQNDRLYYMMAKNTKQGSLKLPEKALLIIEQYRESGHKRDDLIFPDLKKLDLKESKFIVQRTIAFTTSRIDKTLKTKVAPLISLEKPLTMHIARHTFGHISGDKIPVQMLQKLYRHSSITTTIGYQANFIHKDADDALESVINF